MLFYVEILFGCTVGDSKNIYTEMKGVLGHDSPLVRLYWAGDNLGFWDEFVLNHAPGGESIVTVRAVDQQSSELPLYQGCPRNICSNL